jgi:hypothetical protein
LQNDDVINILNDFIIDPSYIEHDINIVAYDGIIKFNIDGVEYTVVKFIN